MHESIRTNWRLEDVQAATAGYDLIFKHSDLCDLSALAAEALLDALDEASGEFRVWMLTVQDKRALSDTIAKALAIPHATPQVIILRDGIPVEMRSHRGITREWLLRWINHSPLVKT